MTNELDTSPWADNENLWNAFKFGGLEPGPLGPTAT